MLRPLRALLVPAVSLVLGLTVLGVPTSTAQAVEAAAGAALTAAPTGLTLGQLAAPVDVEDLTDPLLGWQVGAGEQTAYQVQVATTEGGVPEAGVWDSGKVASAASTNVAYAGPALEASNGYYWRVRTWGVGNATSEWSAVSHFGTGPGGTWSGAQPIWAPATESGWRDVTYEGTFNITATAASLDFRAKDNNNFYMWQFRASNAATEPGVLKTHANANNSFTVLEVNPLPFALDTGVDHAFRIVTAGSSISTYLRSPATGDFVLVDQIDNGEFAAGGIGFRHGSTETASYDDLRVTSPDGEVLYSNDFSAPSSDFTCGTVTGGRLAVSTSRVCHQGVEWQNYTTEAVVNITTGTAAVSLKASSTTNFYLWQLKVGNPGTLQINRQVNSVFTTIKTVPLGRPITTGTDHRIRVVARGSTYETYVDDVLVDTLTDTTHSIGRVGVRTGGFEDFTLKSLKATAADGTVLFTSTFPAGSTDLPCGTAGASGLAVPRNANCLVAAPNTNWAFLRGDVDLAPDKQLAWAHLFATGGSTNPGRQYVYKMAVNGAYVGIGPTRPINAETRYDGYDVTSLLRAGETNTIGALAHTTSDQRYLAQLVVRYTDGTTQTFGTGADWRVLNGGAVLPEAGSIGTSYFVAPKENFRAGLYPTGFDRPGFDDTAWETPRVKPAFADLQATPTAKVERQLRTPTAVTETTPGNYFVDYGRTWVGGLSLDLESTTTRDVDLRYGVITSAPQTAKFATDGGNNYQDRWRLEPGRNQLETWGMRVFRYVNVLNAPTGLGVEDFPAMAYVYPYDPDAGVFESSDDDLNAVWQLNKNTVESTNGNLYVDSWERERGAYEADSYLQMMANFYTSSDPTLGNYSIAYLFKQRTWPTEWPMYIILAMRDSYAQTGDIDALETYYTDLQGKLPAQWFEESTGLIRKANGSNGAGSCTDCDIVDWPSGERDGFVFTPYNTVINAISYRSYADMAEIAAALGKTDDATAYAARAERIKTAVNERMWDETKGAYRDGLSAAGAPTAHWAVQSSVFATAFGLADEEQAAGVAAYIGTRGMACSVYCAAFLYEALYNGDRADVAYDLLTATDKRSYLNMIADGAGATAEAWDKDFKSNLTYSHPWAASVAYNLPQGMFGIKPTTAGYGTFDVKPQPDSLDWAHVTVPTLKGTIGAAFDTGAQGTDIGVHVPGNTTARVLVPGAPEGTTEVFLDGRPTPATWAEGYAVVETVGAGCHVLSLTAGTAATQNPRLTSICPAGWTDTADVTAPTLTATLDPAVPDGAAGWWVGEVALTLDAVDAESAIGAVEYRAGDGEWTAYTGPVAVPDAATTYAVRATDAAGNTSTESVVQVDRDATAPTVSATTDPSAPASGPLTITLAAQDVGSGVAGIRWSLDGGEWTAYDEGVVVTGQGSHELRFEATDVAGNTSAEQVLVVDLAAPETPGPDPETPTPDTTAPSLVLSTDPGAPTGADGWWVAPVSVSASATDASGVARVEYRIDDGPWQTYTAPVTPPPGVTVVAARAVDTRGNTSGVASLTVRLDPSAPRVSARTWKRSGRTTVRLAARDPQSAITATRYRVDRGAWKVYRRPIPVTGPGRHVVRFQTVNGAGLDSVRKRRVVVVRR